jgi:hypothetical protein
MNIEMPENPYEEKPSNKVWKIIKILLVISTVFTISLVGWNYLSKTSQTEIYLPEPTTQEQTYQTEQKLTLKPIQISNNEKVLLGLGFMLLVVVGLDRKWVGQNQDTFATIIGIALIFLSSYIDKLSENSLTVIVASVLIVYLAAFLGKLDFSAPGGYWGVIAILGAVIGNVGAFQTHYNIKTSFLLPFQDVIGQVLTKNTEAVTFSLWIYSMIIISALHFLLELLGLRFEIIKEKSKRGVSLQWNPRWVGLGISLVMILIPFLLTRFTDIKLWLAMLTAIGISIVLVASKQQFIVGTRTNEESFSSAAVGRVMLQSQWDGIAFGIVLNACFLLLTSLYG